MSSNQVNRDAERPRHHVDPEHQSMALAISTFVLVLVWMLITLARTSLGEVLATPHWWFTAAIPIWIVFLIFVWQMVALTNSIMTTSNRETAGVKDTNISWYSFAGILLLCVIWIMLYLFGKIPMTLNHLNGLVAVAIMVFAESRITSMAWTVANRRPGGVIGISQQN